MRRAGLSAAAASCSSTRPPATTRPRSPPRPRPPRSASASATQTCSRSPVTIEGILLIKQGRVERGSRAARRGHGGGHRGRAVADRQRLRLLRRDHGLPGGVRAAPRPGVDRRPDAVVRAAARHGQLQRHVPGASRRDHAAARCLARRAAGGAARRRALRAGENQSAARARLYYREGELYRLQGRASPRPRRPTASASRGGYEPQPGLALLRLAQGDGEAAAAAIRRVVGETTSRRSASGCCRPRSRSCSPSATLEAARSACARARGDRRALGGRHGGCDGRAGRGAVDLADGRRPGRAGRAALRAAGVARARGAVRGGARARAGGTGLRARWATTTRPRWSSRQPASVFARAGSGAGPRPRRRARRRAAAARGAWADGARAAGAAPAWPPARPTRPSPPSWSSARGPWTGT